MFERSLFRPSEFFHIIFGLFGAVVCSERGSRIACKSGYRVVIALPGGGGVNWQLGGGRTRFINQLKGKTPLFVSPGVSRAGTQIY